MRAKKEENKRLLEVQKIADEEQNIEKCSAIGDWLKKVQEDGGIIGCFEDRYGYLTVVMKSEKVYEAEVSDMMASEISILEWGRSGGFRVIVDKMSIEGVPAFVFRLSSALLDSQHKYDSVKYLANVCNTIPRTSDPLALLKSLGFDDPYCCL